MLKDKMIFYEVKNQINAQKNKLERLNKNFRSDSKI